MGTTFINLHIKTKEKELSNYELPEEYVSVKTAEEWLSVYEKESNYNWNKLLRTGRKLSMDLGLAVFAVNYFDDDCFEINVLSQGKTVAYYKVDYRDVFSKGINAIIETLELSKEEASILRYLLKKEMNAESAIVYFSRLFGANLYSDIRMIKDHQTLFEKDVNALQQEMNEEKKRNKVKNVTKLVLKQEIPGILTMPYYGDGYKNIIRLAFPSETGKFDYSTVHCIQMGAEGLKEVYSYNYPREIFTEEFSAIFMEYEHQFIHLIYKNNPLCVFEVDWDKYEPILAKLFSIPDEKLLNEHKTLDIVGYEVYEDKRYGFVCYPQDTLQKIDCIESGYTYNQRKIVAEYKYEELDRSKEVWAGMLYAPVVTSDKVIKIRKKMQRNSDCSIYSVRFFDKDLNLLRTDELELKHTPTVDEIFAYDEETDCIYTGDKILDLKNKEVIYVSKAFKEKNWIFINKNSRNEKNIYLINGSQVYVFDMKMNVVSSHRLKGTPTNWYIGANGNVNIITCGSDVYDYAPKKDSALRRYEIEW